jgi:hypothetical protein
MKMLYRLTYNKCATQKNLYVGDQYMRGKKCDVFNHQTLKKLTCKQVILFLSERQQ